MKANTPAEPPKSSKARSERQGPASWKQRVIDKIVDNYFTAYGFTFTALMLMSFFPLWIDLLLFFAIVVINLHIWNKFAKPGPTADLLTIMTLFQAALIVYGFVLDIDPFENEWGRSDGDYF
jgi:hypothetical protein